MRTEPPVINNTLPESGFMRLSQILGNKRKGIPAIIPVSRSHWYAGIKSGRYPKPVMLSARCAAYLVDDIRSLIVRLQSHDMRESDDVT